MKRSEDTLPAVKSGQPDPKFADQDLIAKSYQVVRLIGLGGSGEGYEVQDLALGSEIVALKALHASEAGDPRGSGGASRSEGRQYHAGPPCGRSGSGKGGHH